MNNRIPKPIDEILLAIQSIHKKMEELQKEMNELKIIINETKIKDTTYVRGWFWS